MEPVCNLPGTVKGVEVLYFPEAEISKTKGSDTSFASFGGLSVLYFKDYNRFVLQLNDWRYPLLRRLSTQSSGNGSYVLPAPNGFTYNLRITNPTGQSLKSLDSLLEGTRKLEASPEDKLVRQPATKQQETGLKEVIGQTIKQTVQKIQNKAATLTTGTKYLTSTKRRINLKGLKTKNFRREAHSKLNKNFFQSGEKLSQEFQQRRSGIPSEARDYEGLRKYTNGPTMYIPRGEIEETILQGKDCVQTQIKPQPTDNMRGDSRLTAPQVQAQKMPVSAEGMTHYSG
jgi:hypothetical protein